MPRRPILSLSLAAALALGVLPVAGAAAQAEGDDEAVDEARSRRSEVEAELGLLRRTDAELEAELGRLDADIATLQQRRAAAETELADLQSRLTVLRADLTVAEARAGEQQDRLVERAIAAYVDPRPQLSMALLADADLEDVGRRRVLLDAVSKRDRDVLDERMAAFASLEQVRTETEQAEARAADLKARSEADLASLEASRVRQREVNAALEARIADFQREADALAGEEARLASLIRARQAATASQGGDGGPTTTAGPGPSTTAAPSTTAPPTTAGPGPTTTTRPGATSTQAPPTTVPATTTTRAPTTTTTTARPSTSLSWPTPGPVTSLFGPRWGRLHAGIDIGAPVGQPISAADGGTVFFAGVMGGYGNLILVDHGNGIVTAYAHQSSFAVGSGTRVSRGQTIGYVGNTGNSTGPHLHFEVRVSGTAVDPMPYLR